MREVEELEERVRQLPEEQLVKFRDWFHEFENELWDKQIESDFKAGKFTRLIAKGRAEMVQGKARKI
jgi:hypothetical protein